MVLSIFGFLCGVVAGWLLGVLVLVTVVFLVTKKLDVDSTEVPQRRSTNEQDAVDIRRHVLHPNIMKKGRFASYVWIVSGDDWDISTPLHKFPPPDYGTGDNKGLVKFYAAIKDGTMRLSWSDVQKRNEVMKIDLEGCRCRLVDECLGMKTVWWRKAPLEISHPSRALYGGCSRLFMFCLHGSDKEQWFIGLSMSMDRGEEIKDIQKIYRRYSKNFRRKTNFLFPSKHRPVVKIEEGAMNEKGTWFTPWRRGVGSKVSSGETVDRSKPLELAEEIEQLWNGGKSRSVFAEEHAKRSFKSQGRKNKTKRHERSLSASIPATDKDFSATDRQTPDSSSRTTDSNDVTGPSHTPQPTAPCLEASSSYVPSSNTDQPTKSSINEGVYGLNMFLARWSFDLARNPEFEQKFRAFIVKKLSGLRRPSYVMPLTLQTFNMGSNFPEIRSIRSLPPRGTVICPELLVDLSYAGGLEVTVETSVDLREASFWDSKDRSLNALHGSSSEQRTEIESMPDGSEIGYACDSTAGAEDDVTSQEDKVPNGFSVRKIAATLAKQVAESISKIPLRLAIKVLKLEGTLLIWMSPPPAKRLWISFMQTPTMEITANPILGNRIMKYSATLGRVSSWLQKKIKESFFKNLVFPNCADVSFPGVLGLTDEDGLRHPAPAVMHDLLYVSEYDSEEEINDTPPPPPSIPSVPQDAAVVEEETVEEAEKKPVVDWPNDDRLDVIRHHRYDPHHLGAMRRNWSGLILDDAGLPSKHRHGRRFVKRCLSFSDGDASPERSELDIGHAHSIVSDCNEFFDADNSFHSVTSSVTDDEPKELDPTVPGSSGGCEREEPEQTPSPEERVTSSRRLNAIKIGGLFKHVQPEDVELRRRHHGNFAGPNKILKAARQKAVEHHQKVKDALETRTAQFRNSGFPRLFLQRRSTDRNIRNE